MSSGQTAQTKGEKLKVIREHFSQITISFGDCGGNSFEYLIKWQIIQPRKTFVFI